MTTPMTSIKKILFFLLLISNFIFISIIGIIEYKTHTLELALARRGIISNKILQEDKLSPDYWARVSWSNTIKKLHIDFDIAFFGNSITRGSDFQLSFPDKKIINLGYSGDNIIGMIKRIDMIKISKAKKVFIMAGTNDLVHCSLQEYEQRYYNLLRTIKDSIPDIHIYIQSLLPSNHKMANYSPNKKIQEANKIAKKLSHSFNCTYINLYDLYIDENNELPKEFTRDGVHLYPQYYSKWAEKIKTFIYE